MRRRVEYRRPARRRLLYWIWALLGLFSVAGFILFAVHHNQREGQPKLDKSLGIQQIGLNHTQDIISSITRQLSEQMILAKAYLIIAKEHNNLQLAWELSSNIRESQLLLSKAARTEVPLTPSEAEPIIKTLASLIYKSQDAHFDIATTIMTMKSHIEALEERANAATIQSMIFGQFAAQSFPKNLHCLFVKLTADWIKEVGDERRNSNSNSNSNVPRFVDNNLYHFCIFSENLLAVSVVINSTVSNADHPKQLVFHVVTNDVSYGAMQIWFLGIDFKGASIEVQKIDEFPVVKQTLESDSDSHSFNHILFYIPEIYPLLEKVIFLEDDVVVQKDLTSLFSLDLHGNVNGAVETCLEAFHRYYKYLNFSNPAIISKIDPQTCGWAFGMNIFDLVKWKKMNVTSFYHYWREQNAGHALWRTGTLPAGLLTFYGITEALDRRWHVLGLGYNMKIDKRLMESAAVLHFNGHMKPWLRLGIGRYKPLWERYVNQTHPYIQDCAAVL